jgi:uncharacterized membrane protein YgcG
MRLRRNPVEPEGAQEYRRAMFDAVLVGALIVLVALTARRALRGTPPRRSVCFAAIVGVAAAIHLGFHVAATAAPSMPSAAALVLTGWSNFLLWCVWLSRAPAPRLGDRPDDDESGGDGRGGGGGPGDGGGPPYGGPGGEDGDPEWDRFEREFADYVQRRPETLIRG